MRIFFCWVICEKYIDGFWYIVEIRRNTGFQNDFDKQRYHCFRKLSLLREMFVFISYPNSDVTNNRLVDRIICTCIAANSAKYSHSKKLKSSIAIFLIQKECPFKNAVSSNHFERLSWPLGCLNGNSIVGVVLKMLNDGYFVTNAVTFRDRSNCWQAVDVAFNTFASECANRPLSFSSINSHKCSTASAKLGHCEVKIENE